MRTTSRAANIVEGPITSRMGRMVERTIPEAKEDRTRWGDGEKSGGPRQSMFKVWVSENVFMVLRTTRKILLAPALRLLQPN